MTYGGSPPVKLLTHVAGGNQHFRNAKLGWGARQGALDGGN